MTNHLPAEAVEKDLLRKQRVISGAWARLMASHLAERFRSKELIQEAGQILGKEMQRETKRKRR